MGERLIRKISERIELHHKIILFEGCRKSFSVLLPLYLMILIAEHVAEIPSRYVLLNTDTLIIPLILTGIFGISSPYFEKQKEEKLSRRDVFLIIGLGITASMILFFKLKDLGAISFVISGFGGMLVILLSLLIFSESGEEQNDHGGERLTTETRDELERLRPICNAASAGVIAFSFSLSIIIALGYLSFVLSAIGGLLVFMVINFFYENRPVLLRKVGVLKPSSREMAERASQKGYFALYQGLSLYLLFLLLATIPFLVVDRLYQAELNKVLGSPEPQIAVKEAVSGDLLYFLRTGDNKIQTALKRSLGPFLLEEVQSKFQKEGEDRWGAAYMDNDQTPGWMTPDTRYTVPLEVINIGSVPWEVEGENPIHLSYRWVDPWTGEVIVEDGLRTPLPRVVAPGEKVIIEARVQSPAQRGTYILSYQMVREQQFWFEQKGSTPLRKTVTVSDEEKTKELPEDLVLNLNVDFVANRANQSSAEIKVAEDGFYNLLIGERWEGTLETLRVKVGQGGWQEISSEGLQDGLADLGELYFDKGTHTIYFQNSVPNYNFDCAGVWAVLLLQKPGSSSPGTGNSQGREGEGGASQTSLVSLKKTNQLEYTAEVKSKGPFFLYLSSPFNPNWTLSSQGQVITLHYREKKGGNIWFVEEGGDYHLTLEYGGMDRLIVLRLASLVAVPPYLLLVVLHLWRRRNKRKHHPSASRITGE